MAAAGESLGRLAAAAGMLVATALAVASLGAIGVLGPLGSLVAGGQGTVLERASDPSGGTRGDDAPIVADSTPLAPTTTSQGGTTRVSTPARPVRRRSGGDAPSGTTGPQAPAPRPPGTPPGTPVTTVPQPPPPAPPQRPPVVGAATDTIRTTAAQLPPPGKPAGDVLTGVADTVDATCGRLAICP